MTHSTKGSGYSRGGCGELGNGSPRRPENNPLHFDEGLREQSYVDFRKKNALHIIVNGREMLFCENPAFVSLRQIAYEVLMTFLE